MHGGADHAVQEVDAVIVHKRRGRMSALVRCRRKSRGREAPTRRWFAGTHRSLNDPRLDKSYLRLRKGGC